MAVRRVRLVMAAMAETVASVAQIQEFLDVKAMAETVAEAAMVQMRVIMELLVVILL